jgi:hypothetical protein
VDGILARVFRMAVDFIHRMVVSGPARELDFEREVYSLELSKRLADDAAAKRKPKKKRAGR